MGVSTDVFKSFSKPNVQTALKLAKTHPLNLLGCVVFMALYYASAVQVELEHAQTLEALPTITYVEPQGGSWAPLVGGTSALGMLVHAFRQKYQLWA